MCVVMGFVVVVALHVVFCDPVKEKFLPPFGTVNKAQSQNDVHTHQENAWKLMATTLSTSCNLYLALLSWCLNAFRIEIFMPVLFCFFRCVHSLFWLAINRPIYLCVILNSKRCNHWLQVSSWRETGIAISQLDDPKAPKGRAEHLPVSLEIWMKASTPLSP